MRKVSCPVREIYSYQTLVKQTARGRYRTPRYKQYRMELAPNIRKLKSIKDKKAPIFIHITFNVKGAVKPDEWKLVMKETGKTARIYHSEAEAIKNKKDRHIIEYSPFEISFGATGDDDNIIKPIKDLMEDLRVIPNDRQGCITTAEFTYNNPANFIEIEISKLNTVIDKNGIYRFTK